MRKQLSVVPDPPAQVRRQYADFDRFVAIANKIVAHVDAACELCTKIGEWLDGAGPEPSRREIEHAEHLAAQGAGATELMAKFEEADAYYNRAELYDHCGTNDEAISRRFVAEQIGVLIGSAFPNPPQSPDIYGPMLIEEVIAAGPSALAVESVCRQIRRTATTRTPPQPAQFLKLLNQQSEYWYNVRASTENVATWQRELEAMIRQAKERLAAITTT
jgi:hypothetical protein